MTHLDSQPDAEKTALAPDLRRMADRTARAWVERMAVRPLGDGRYAVDSQSGATYVVDLEAGTCTCADHRTRGVRCKHLRRVALEITARRVPPPGRRVADCVACGRSAFVLEGDEPPLCDACRLESGDVVLDRETGDRLVVRRVTDRRADEVEIPATGRTVADHPTNGGYDPADLVVEAVYAGDLARRDEPRVYSFPHGRLDPVDDAAIVD